MYFDEILISSRKYKRKILWIKKVGGGIVMKKKHHPPFIFSDPEIRYQYLQNELLINVR
jgi:hypothetical protein